MNMLYKLEKFLGKNFKQEARKYVMHFISADRVDKEYDSEPFKKGEEYCRIWLVEMGLAEKVKWFKERYPAVHSSVEFRYRNDAQTIPYLAGPGNLEKSSKGGQSRMIGCNYALTPIFPYNGGLVEIEAGLFNMEGENHLGKIFDALDLVTGIIPMGSVSSILKLSSKLCTGIDGLLGIGSCEMEIGCHSTFSAPGDGGDIDLRPGYLAVILAEDVNFNEEELCIVDGRLHVGPTGPGKPFLADNTPFEGYSHMLLRIEKRAEYDMETLPEIYDLMHRAVVAKYTPDAQKQLQGLLNAIQIAVMNSDDLVEPDKFKTIDKIQKKLTGPAETPSVGAKPVSSTAKSVKLGIPLIDTKTEAELLALEEFLHEEH
jgi:hypothetical protein